ncbi:MAG: hypothetical protein ABJJ38_00490 [Roseibium sp.]|uniref:hypothetical protein n=1 Tax=Roseibium sp. TaxID=1936156 RepID=UPI00329730BC
MATDLNAAFQKMRGAPKRTPMGNVIVKVEKINEKTITGEIQNGPNAGTSIEFKPGGHLDVADYKKGKTKVIEGEGLLRVEGLKEGKDGVYDTRWCKTFVGKPDDKHTIINDAQVSLYASVNRDGTPKRDVNKAQIMNLIELHADGEVLVESADDFRKAIVDSMVNGRTAAVVGATDEFFNMTMAAPKGDTDKDGKYTVTETPKDVADRLVANLGGDEPLNELLGQMKIAVVPVTRHNVGSDTSMAIETTLKEKGPDAMVGTVDPKDFVPMSIGLRLANALRSQDKEVVAQIEDAFMATASDAGKKALMNSKGGFAGVAKHDVEAFLEAHGVELEDHGSRGWSKNSVALTERYNNADSKMVIKSFRTGGISAYPLLKVTEPLNERVRDEMTRAVDTVLEGLRAKAGVQEEAPAAKKAEEKAPAQKAEDEKPAKEAEGAEAAAEETNDADAEAGIDDLLNSLAEEEPEA